MKSYLISTFKELDICKFIKKNKTTEIHNYLCTCVISNDDLIHTDVNLI